MTDSNQPDDPAAEAVAGEAGNPIAIFAPSTHLSVTMESTAGDEELHVHAAGAVHPDRWGDRCRVAGVAR